MLPQTLMKKYVSSPVNQTLSSSNRLRKPSIFDRIMDRPGKRKITTLFLGGLSALAFAPVTFFPILLLTLSGFLRALDHTSHGHCKRESFALGWLFGLGYFTCGLYWITFALGVDLAQFFWLIPLTIFGIPAILALFIGAMAWALAMTRTRGWPRVLAFAVLWSTFEWARGHAFTGLPWNLVGYTWVSSSEMLQTTAFIGIYGLGFVTVLLASLPYLWHIRALKLGSTVLVLGVCLWGGGLYRLSEAPNPNTYAQDEMRPIVRLVQPSIPQTLKWQPERAEEHLQTLITLTQQPFDRPPRIVVWPETAVAYALEEGSTLLPVLAEAIPGDSLLMTGAPRRILHPGQPMKVWNSFFAIDGAGTIQGVYDKSHLVPFGEYIPLRRFLPDWITKFTPGDVDFSAGPGPQTLTFENTPAVSPLICYEGIFPGAVISHSLKRPEWLVNVTNDGWYGRTSGPYQHFQSVRVRAIEEGLPLVRAANNGLSGVVDAYGREMGRLPLDAVGVLDLPLPPPLTTPPLYALFGDRLFGLLLLIMGVVALIGRSRNKQES